MANKLPKEIKEIFRLKWVPYAARNISFLMSYSHLLGYWKFYPRYINTRFQYVIFEGKRYDWQMYRNKKEQQKIVQYVHQLVKRKRFLKEMVIKGEKALKRFKNVSDKIGRLNVKTLSNQKIGQLILEYAFAFPFYTSAMSTLIFALDAIGENLKKLLAEKGLDKDQQNEILGLLSTPIEITLPVKEELDFIKLVNKIKKNKKIIKEISNDNWPSLLNQHFNRYCWLLAYIDGAVEEKTEFLQRVKQARPEKNLNAKAKNIIESHKKTEANINKKIKELNLDAEYIKFFRQGMYHRILAESFYGYGNLKTQNLFKETAKRLYLSLKQLRYLSPLEVAQALKKPGKDYTKITQERFNHYLLILSRSRIHIFPGKLADKIIKNLPRVKEEKLVKGSKEIKGTIAYKGFVKGKVRVLDTVEKVNKLKKGEILVAINTTPSYVPAMKKASAIVTDEGGVTCHAAIVSRELGVPCIVGTKIATKVLKDGDKVEVDATKGIIKKL